MPDGLEPDFPLEFIVFGTPVSAQAARISSRMSWKARIKAASRAVLPEGHWASERPVAVTLFYFPAGRMRGDVDNIVKLTLDAMSAHIYLDDSQVERIVVQKFEPGNIFPFVSPSASLAEALASPKPLLYVKISDRPFEDLT